MAGGTRALALAVAAAALAACGSGAEPRLAAACGPDVTMEQVTCMIRNNGTAASRACFTARVQPPAGVPLVARRVCTAVLEPGQSAEVMPPFEQLDRVKRAGTLAGRCLRQGRWLCKVDIVETPRQMAGQDEP